MVWVKTLWTIVGGKNFPPFVIYRSIIKIKASRTKNKSGCNLPQKQRVKGIDMNTQKLIQNLIDQIKEAQLKLGYAEESMYFYFPPYSLNDILQTDLKDEESLLKELRQAPDLAESVLGELGFELNRGRIQVWIPPQGVRYVKENVPDPAFLWDLIQLFSQGHNLTIERIKNCFQKFSNN